MVLDQNFRVFWTKELAGTDQDFSGVVWNFWPENWTSLESGLVFGQFLGGVYTRILGSYGSEFFFCV